MVEKLVVSLRGEVEAKKYYRFRVDRWYGGIATADCVGCGLMCRFCWVADQVMRRPTNVGEFYAPEAVADRLMYLAAERGVGQLRVSGGEPTIGRRHLIQLLDSLENRGRRFVLETNGILIASEQGYAEELAGYRFVEARVSLKGCDEQEFATLTGAKPQGFTLQLEALERLSEAGVSCYPAVMSLQLKEGLVGLASRLREINPELERNLEIEELILYPHVRRRLEEYGLSHSQRQYSEF